MRSVKIVIPSHKRADRVRTKEIVKDAIICVEKSQEGIYREFNPQNEIVTHPDSVKGLVPKRNWMVQHFGELFMMDDDISGLARKWGEKNESLSLSKDPEYNWLRIQELYDLAKIMGVSLFGFSPFPNPLSYKPFKPIRLDLRITGCAYGVIKSPNTWWPEDLKVKEDFWISGLIKSTERVILVDDRFYFNQIGTFDSPGGAFRDTKYRCRKGKYVKD